MKLTLVMNTSNTVDINLKDAETHLNGKDVSFDYIKDNGEGSNRVGAFERVSGKAICIREEKGFRSFKVSNIRGFRVYVL